MVFIKKESLEKNKSKLELKEYEEINNISSIKKQGKSADPENKYYDRLLTRSFLPLLLAQETQILSCLPRLLARLTKTADCDQEQVPT